MKWLLMALLCTLPVWAEEPAAPDPDPAAPLEQMLAADSAAAPGTKRDRLEVNVFRREEPYQYSAHGRRDPFRALIVDQKKEGAVETDLLLLEGATLTGVVWSDNDYLAMVKDKNGLTFFLREGDDIYQGRLVTITQSVAIFEVSDFGDYEQVTLKVQG